MPLYEILFGVYQKACWETQQLWKKILWPNETKMYIFLGRNPTLIIILRKPTLQWSVVVVASCWEFLLASWLLLWLNPSTWSLGYFCWMSFCRLSHGCVIFFPFLMLDLMVRCGMFKVWDIFYNQTLTLFQNQTSLKLKPINRETMYLYWNHEIAHRCTPFNQMSDFWHLAELELISQKGRILVQSQMCFFKLFICK